MSSTKTRTNRPRSDARSQDQRPVCTKKGGQRTTTISAPTTPSTRTTTASPTRSTQKKKTAYLEVPPESTPPGPSPPPRSTTRGGGTKKSKKKRTQQPAPLLSPTALQCHETAPEIDPSRFVTAIDGTEAFADYPGISVQYDPAKFTYFQVGVLQALDTINSKKLGKKLLRRIGRATPANRGDFAQGINCIFKPVDICTVEGGHRLLSYADKDGATVFRGLRQDRTKPECNYCSDTLAAVPSTQHSQDAGNGRGITAHVRFNSAHMIDRRGNITVGYIVTAHELIHVSNYLAGRVLVGRDEELRTVGLGDFADEDFTENKFRRLFKIPEREAYGNNTR